MEDKIKAIRSWLGSGSINLFGMPYAGKDTQGEVLADLLGAELMGGGQILRNSVIPERVRTILDAGKLIPTEDFITIVLPYLSHERFANKPLILSSVGRWDGEQFGVLEAVEAAKHPIKAVILLTIAEETARQRHKNAGVADRGVRADDAPEVFNDRLLEFQNKTLPVIDFYDSKNLLIRVDGTVSPPEVTSQIINALAELARP